MYAVISSPTFWKEIEQSIISRGAEILFKVIDKDVDMTSELQNISRIAIKYLIIDISAIEEDHKKFIKAIRNYRVMNGQTQIIIIAPDCYPGNELIHSLVTIVQIHDIIAPEGDTGVLSSLMELYDNPSPYKKALKWIIDPYTAEEQEPQVLSEKKRVNFIEFIRNNTQTQEKEIVRNVPIVRKGLKDTIITFGWANSGKSFILTNLAVMLARAGAKVALVEGNVQNPELFSFFEVENDHVGYKTLLRSNNDDILDYAYSPIKNLYVFALLPFTKSDSIQFDLVTIQDKLRNNVDVILVDSPFLFDNNFTTNLKYVSKVLLTVTPHVAKLFTLTKSLENIYNQGVNLGKFDVILNQYLSSKEISSEAIETILNQDLTNLESSRKMIKIAAVVPPIYPSAYESHMVGKPLALSQKGESISQALSPVMNSIWAVESRKKGLFSLFKRS